MRFSIRLRCSAGCSESGSTDSTDVDQVSEELCTPGNWAQVRSGPGHTGFNAEKHTLDASNVALLAWSWSGREGQLAVIPTDCGPWCSPLVVLPLTLNAFSPVVADGSVYVSSGQQVFALRAD
jgi:hypothetical protein